LELARQGGLPLGDYVADRAAETARAVLEKAPVMLDVRVFDRKGNPTGKSDA
ncbi:MAG TPA: cobalt-precorrin-5B (C(1))-methyltransferase, partial [Rhodospirillaceae bacterium]|nr:cobalt-precorrin-5B (C(1))-methyltransferase [Rhodospirillaceae bacterium]